MSTPGARKPATDWKLVQIGMLLLCGLDPLRFFHVVGAFVLLVFLRHLINSEAEYLMRLQAEHQYWPPVVRLILVWSLFISVLGVTSVTIARDLPLQAIFFVMVEWYRSKRTKT